METPLLAIASFVTGIGAIITAWSALKRARATGAADCREELRLARIEAERTAAELHRVKMRQAGA